MFVPAEAYDGLKPWERYRLRCAAYGYAYPRYVVAGRSAAALWDMASGSVPEEVELGRRAGSGPVGASGVRNRKLPGEAPGREPVLHRGLWLTSPIMTTIDLARWHSLVDAVGAADSGMRGKQFTLEDLEGAAGGYRGYRGRRHIEDLLTLAHPASESPRESAMRVLLWQNGFPVPHLQAVISSAAGRFIGRVDALFPQQSTILEYDGELKYSRAFGKDPEQTMREELERQKALLNAGTRMVRVTAATFRDQSWMEDLRRELKRGEGNPLPENQWSSAGLGWGTRIEKTPVGGAFRI
ncbi:hypothetical protein [Corynebacterium pacaense]|uniref:hypothetical protein n=1 Tax=Corynebacterium pacaense TaxID=1816684 RepID=UPI001FEB880E|nr:hypothetical protein [Corynebacterium pacaense]